MREEYSIMPSYLVSIFSLKFMVILMAEFLLQVLCNGGKWFETIDKDMFTCKEVNVILVYTYILMKVLGEDFILGGRFGIAINRIKENLTSRYFCNWCVWEAQKETQDNCANATYNSITTLYKVWIFSIFWSRGYLNFRL